MRIRAIFGGLMAGLAAAVVIAGPARAAGPEAEPEDSGSWIVSLSPGVTYILLDNVSILLDNVSVYGLVQLPIYRQVSGVQLTANWVALVAISTRF